MYLFGASPALASGFLRGRPHKLDTLSDDTLYLPYATSLRMSDLGYQNDAQSGLRPHENSLDDYVNALTHAVNDPYAPYEELGTRKDGEWIQLSTNVLQIENEYYSTIRPKRVIRTGERPIQALCLRGVQYIEVRCMDVDPFEPVGISLPTGRFLDAFLLFCALDESAPISSEQSACYTANFARTVKEGRKPGLTLRRDGEDIGLQAWGEELLARIAPVAALLDARHGGTEHADSLAAQAAQAGWTRTRRRRRACCANCAPTAARLPPSACSKASAMRRFSASSRQRPNRALLRPAGRNVAGRTARHGSGAARQLRRLRGRPTAPAPCVRTPDSITSSQSARC